MFLLCSHLDPWKNYLSISEEFHISIWGRGWDSRIVVFNDAEYGPYRGSIISLVDANGNDLNPRVREVAFGTYAGIYYRYFEWIDDTLWTFMLSMWYPIIVFAIIPLGHILIYIKKRARGNQHTLPK
ncbi:MAG: hypothetical protein SFX18_12860 [Pirellulales bacterium]|nr:hypothetical protein [Pirellulales bacterium]